ncbi:MAG TPA: ABC transporter ATP-binding protein [Roseiflexaceae bacterium]|nr:ABC transporter ATP-binding protein [Roseiflexaceae bacterium]
MDAAILTEGLTKRYGERTVVDSVDLQVAHGEIFGFLGPNGAGKTTTIGMLLGLIRPSTGRAVVLGHDIQQAPGQALAGVGAMVETPAFYPYLSGRDNLRVLARAGGLHEERVAAVLKQVELSSRARDSFKTYSLGMKQRLGIAAALLHDPRLIILDEPTNGLDPAGQLEIRELIRTLAQGGHTIFLSSHMLHEVEQLCGRVAILRQGRIVKAGRVDELLRRGQGVLVRVHGDAAQARALLEGQPWVRKVEPHDGALLVDVPVERAPEITMLLATHAIPVAEIRAHEERLEDLFLEVTRK